MDKTNMFGKTYNTIGSTDSNFIIKTKGDLKVQWGGKFIDIIKNGKLASSQTNIFKTVSSIDNISGNGIYLVPTDDGNEIWVSIDGTKVNIAGEIGTTYVSFLTEQKEVTADQKYIALVNAGLYYETLEDAQEAGIKAGIIFIVGENKLYIAKDGQLSEYIASSTSSDENENTYFDEITVKNLKIYEENSNMIISSPNISFVIDGQDAVQLGSQLKSYLSINMLPETYIQSNNATPNSGYRLYVKGGKSILEVDSIIWREMDTVIDQTTKLEDAIIYSTNTNVIQSAEDVEDEENQILCRLKYKNTFTVEDKVYILVPLSTQVQQEDDQDEDEEDDYEISNKGQLIECSIVYTDDQFIAISIDPDIKEEFIENSPGSFICQSNIPLIKIQQNNIDVLDRSKTVTDENTSEEVPDNTIHTRIGVINEQDFEQLKECPEEQEEVQVGIYSDNFIGLNSKMYDTIFKKRCQYPKYDDNLNIPETELNSDQYNKIVPDIEWVKELLKLAVPSGTIAMFNGKSDIPEGWAICDGTKGTPNLVGKFIKGVSSTNDIGENTTDLDSENKLTIKETNLPAHSHPHESHTHTITSAGTVASSGSLSMSSTDTFAYYLGEKEVVTSVDGVEGITTETAKVYNSVTYRAVNTSGGSHTHSVSIGSVASSTTSQEASKTWNNTAIKVEPHSYSLIFIMKL